MKPGLRSVSVITELDRLDKETVNNFEINRSRVTLLTDTGDRVPDQSMRETMVLSFVATN
jgi:hypothetical protein